MVLENNFVIVKVQSARMLDNFTTSAHNLLVIFLVMLSDEGCAEFLVF